MNCKPGDIAMITSQRNYGRLVEVVRFLGDYCGTPSAWLARTLQPCSAFRGAPGRFGGIPMQLPAGAKLIVRDAYLKPFQPPPEEETTETEKELETA